MTKLTAKQESFLTLMKGSEELARRGFQLLLKRKDFVQFFDPLQQVGFFDADKNPAPQPGEREGTVRIPYWAPLDYLTAVARTAGQENDLALANKVLAVVRAVSTWRDPNGQPRSNYQTNRVFAEILGIVPTGAVTINDLSFLPVWLNDPYERMLVTHALDKGALPRFLNSAEPEDRAKAVTILRHCTAIKWHNEDDGQQRTPSTVVDDFWLGDLLKHHAKACGSKAGTEAAKIMLGRVREVFSTPIRRDHSRVFRPAIEDHHQNHRWRSAENRMVEALRDVLLGWCEHDSDSALPFVRTMLHDELEIVRRVGIYILAQHWTKMNGLYNDIVGPGLFDNAHLHELYDLLNAHFAEMTKQQQAATITAIQTLPLPSRGDNPTRLRRRTQQRWLAAIIGKGNARVDEWFSQLQGDPTVGKVPDHPDFDAYMQASWGPGPTAYSPAELTTMAVAHILVDNLNSFQEPGVWRGPTLDGLTSALEAAVRTTPRQYLAILNDFLNAKPVYQHALINGLQQAWESKDTAQESVKWDEGWEQLIAFFEQLVQREEFWQATQDVHQHWVVAAVADCLRAGTHDDAHAYAPDLLARTQAILAVLLNKEPAADHPQDDAMTQAINTPKGRVIEALFSQALRAARTSDKATGAHQLAWASIRPLFEAELAKCNNANYEFSTLCGTYLPQLQYLDQEWSNQHVDEIFPEAYELNTVCAVDGLAYATFAQPVYALLVQHGIIDRALRLELKGRNAREKLLERIGAAYLWGEETLDAPRIAHIFDTGRAEDLEVIARVFWIVRNEPLRPEQKQRILAFWERCVTWTKRQREAPARLLSFLSLLAVYVTTVEKREQELLKTVAPYVHIGHEAYEFIAELLRLAPTNPAEVTAVLEKMIAARAPDYDYEDRLRALLRTLAEKGQRDQVILMAERLRQLPGIQELYDELTTIA